jgi:prepilin-type N-terminal cleavage/methylation domain-containing protein
MKRTGLTLIEILIVVAIVLLLFAISIPIYRAAKEAGTRSACSQNLRQIQQALEIYEGAHDGIGPARIKDLLAEAPSLSSVLICPKDSSKGFRLYDGSPRGDPSSPNFVPTSYEMYAVLEQAALGHVQSTISSSERLAAACWFHVRAQNDVLTVFADGHVSWWDKSKSPPWVNEWQSSNRTIASN